MDYKFDDRRRDVRKPLLLDAEYELNGTLCSCNIVDISARGIGMRVKGCLIVGDKINIILDKNNITAKVVRVDGNIVGVMFDQLSNEMLNYILSLNTL